MFAYCPYVFARQAHSQLLLIGFLPWSMLAFHRFIDRASPARAIECGLVLWLTGMASAYYGLFAAGMVGLGTIHFAVTRGLWRQPRHWALVALAATVCIGLTAPLFLPYLRMQAATGFARPLEESFSANLAAWVISSAWTHRWWAPFLAHTDKVLFPGIIATVFGIWGAVIATRSASNRPRPDAARFTPDVAWFYVITAVAAFWTSFGPQAGLYALLYHAIPILSFLQAPARAGIVVTLCLVVLAAPALIRVMRSPSHMGERRSAMCAMLVVLVVADLYRAPLRLYEAPPVPTAYRTLAQLPRGPVIKLPFWPDRPSFDRQAEYMLASTYHWQPMVNGYSDHIPQDFRDHAPLLSGFPSRESFAILETLGVRYAMFYLGMMDDETIGSLVARLDHDYGSYLQPLEKDGDVWLYEIVAWPSHESTQ